MCGLVSIRKMGINCFFLVHLQFLRLITLGQFIFNLKQDGKALPDGPVVISPDGLFLYLYREGCLKWIIWTERNHRSFKDFEKLLGYQGIVSF